MNMCVLDLKALTKADHKYVGHKAANLGELHQIKGIQVPDGFCITTAAFKESAPIKKLTASLDGCGLNDMDRIRWISSEIRSLIEVTPIPQDVVKEIFEMISHFGKTKPMQFDPVLLQRICQQLLLQASMIHTSTSAAEKQYLNTSKNAGLHCLRNGR